MDRQNILKFSKYVKEHTRLAAIRILRKKTDAFARPECQIRSCSGWIWQPSKAILRMAARLGILGGMDGEIKPHMRIITN
jgi:hypothetical protein